MLKEEYDMKRQSGILLPITALPSGFGVGTLGRGAIEFIDLLADSGFSVWQVLPFCMPDEKNSPYKSCASYSANYMLIDPEALFADGLITEAELATAREAQPYVCEYEQKSSRLELLSLAAARASDEVKEAASSFVDSMPRLAKTAEFLSLKEANGGAPWQEWSCHTPDPVRLYFWKFVLYTFHKQWRAVREHAKARGVKIIGDIPMYVDLDSADVWAEPELFKLDSKGYPTAVAGVPPDAFSEEGQLWGNPLYNWSRMRADSYAWWQDRLEYNLSLFDGIRIDHFRALEAYYSIPNGAKSAKEGKWMKGPGLPFVKILRRLSKDSLIIAEDLGVITDGVRALLDASGLPGMRVLQFATPVCEPSVHLPHTYIENCVAYTGTHDNNTLLGALYEMSESERRDLLDYAGVNGDNLTAATHSLVRMMLRSAAGLVIIPIQDLLAYGKDTRINTPGVPDGNWSYRVTAEQLASLDRESLRYYNRLYGRGAPDGE